MLRSTTFFLIFLAAAAFVACTTTEQAAERDDIPGDEVSGEAKEEMDEELPGRLDETRSRLSDLYLTQQHDIPEAFLKKDTTENTYNNPFAGYRVQVLSTRNVTAADSISTDFRLWADSTFANYVPKAYVFFRQPYYKVHIGDFQDRQRANNLSRIIKQKYPDAWVVHDRIDPEAVPPDTTQIRLMETEADSTDPDSESAFR